MDLHIVKPNAVQQAIIKIKIRQLGYAPDAEIMAWVDAKPWPWVNSETINVIRLYEETASEVIAHEGLHIVLLRIGERTASFLLDYKWAHERVN